MKKNLVAPLAPKKLNLHRETLRQLDAELLAVRGGLLTYNKACEPTSQCTTSTGCSVTACGHC
jgi:hypothetical protein